MDLQTRIISFVKLGDHLRNHFAENNTSQKLFETIWSYSGKNTWFTIPNIEYSLSAWANLLTFENLSNWLSNYPLISDNKEINKVGVVMAGNIPLVGFHDMLCVLLSGNIFIGKLSSKDDRLIRTMANMLIDIEPEWNKYIFFEENQLRNFNAIIATGSNNTSRYFEYYFGKYPNIIRRNRNSVAILNGKESEDELQLLADDIFVYFGLGCRNVYKLFLPKGYPAESVISFFQKYSPLNQISKYANNYDYNKAIFLVNSAPYIDGGFFLMKENSQIASPVSVLNYAFYEKVEELEISLLSQQNELQCIIGNVTNLNTLKTIPFGNAQKPALNDYADGIDTLKFLTELNLIPTQKTIHHNLQN